VAAVCCWVLREEAVGLVVLGRAGDSGGRGGGLGAQELLVFVACCCGRAGGVVVCFSIV
jgi:hypothetical protein